MSLIKRLHCTCIKDRITCTHIFVEYFTCIYIYIIHTFERVGAFLSVTVLSLCLALTQTAVPRTAPAPSATGGRACTPFTPRATRRIR